MQMGTHFVKNIYMKAFITVSKVYGPMCIYNEYSLSDSYEDDMQWISTN